MSAGSAVPPEPVQPTESARANQPSGGRLTVARHRLDTPAPWSVVAVALALAFVCLGVALAALLTRPSGTDELAAARASALDAVRERTAAITSYTVGTLDADIAAVQKDATEPFRTEYADATQGLRATVTASQAKAVGSVVAAGLESASQDRAVAVVAVDQIIQAKGAQPRRERNRLRITLVRPDGTWLVERVDRL